MKRTFLLFLLSAQLSGAAIVDRWFDVTSAGSGDGTSHANRAALFSSGNWSTVITGFNFSGSDSLRCYIEAGSYTCSQALASGLFTNAPSQANPLLLLGADSSGNILSIPDTGWVSAQPAWSTSTLPTIATTTNIATINLASTTAYLINFTASGRNSTVIAGGCRLFWCQVSNSAANTAAAGVANGDFMYGSVISCTGSSYDSVILLAATTNCQNVRVVGNSSASSGNRRGVTTSTTLSASRLTVINNPGEGIISTSSSTGASIQIARSVIANNTGTAFKAHSTASQTTNYLAEGCMITGNNPGIDGNSNAARFHVQANRLRNTTSDITGIGNYPTNLGNDTTAGNDTDEYADATNGDFRIKNTSIYWGLGYGAGDQPKVPGFFIQ